MSTHEVTVTISTDRPLADTVQSVLFAINEETSLNVVGVTGAVNV